MTGAEYAELATACDAFLRSPFAGPMRIALSSLHVLNEHPVNLERFDDVYGRRGGLPRVRARLRRSLSIARLLERALLRRDASAERYAGSAPGVDVLIISHLVSTHGDSGGATDFYYGDLATELAKRGLTSLTAQHNHIGARPGFRESNAEGLAARMVLPLWTTFQEEFSNINRANRAAQRLLEECTATGDSLQRRVALNAVRYAASPPTLVALRTQKIVHALCRRFEPRLLLVTWEGHAWERMAFHGARTANPRIRCAAYQHTILLPRSHALRRSLGEQYDPDVLLTAGDVNRDVLAASPGLSRVPILTYGSHRRFAGMPKRAPDAATRVVVIPEGLESECVVLCDFAITAAMQLPNVEFVLRMHPVLPFRRLQARYARFRTLPRNVRQSTELDIIDDFAKCNWALYRGSSAAIHAVLAGVRPVYLERPGEMEIDPLFALAGWRRKVRESSSFADVVESDLQKSSNEREAEWEPARAFCDRYVVAPNPEVIAGLLTD